MKKASLILVAVATVIALGSSAYSMDMPDRIILKNDSSIANITVTAADAQAVTYTKLSGGATEKVKIDEIKDINWGDLPNDVKLALQEMRKEKPNYESALQKLDKAPAKLPNAARDFYYGPLRRTAQAEALIALGKQADALIKLQEIVKDYPNSFYTIEAIKTKADVHLALKQYAEVVDTVAKFDPQNQYKDAIAQGPYGKIWQLRGRIMMVEAAMATGKVAEASEYCVGLTEVCDKFNLDMPAPLRPYAAEVRTIHQKAIVYRADILLKDKKLAEAAQWIDNVADKISEPAARIKMFVTYGDIQMQVATAETDRVKKEAKFKQAALAYMKIYILFPDAKEQRAKAMISAAKALMAIGSAADNGAAVRLCKEISETFPGSPEAKEADTMMRAIGVR